MRTLKSMIKKTRDKQTEILLLAIICLLTGLALYLLYRPKTLVLFRWVEAVGLIFIVDILRDLLNGTIYYIPGWIIYSLPFALWVVAYMFFIEYIWGQSRSSAKRFWIWLAPFAAISFEIAQGLRLIPGHFDLMDVVVLIIAVIVAQLLIARSHSGKII